MNELLSAIVLAGGEEEALRPLTCDVPKPMIRLCGRPLIAYTLDLLERHGVQNARVCVNYLPTQVAEGLGEQHQTVALQYLETDRDRGAVESVRRAALGLSDAEGEVLVMSGEILTDADLTSALAFHRAAGAAATLVVTRVSDPREHTLVDAGEDGRVTGVMDKPGWSQAATDTADMGVYIFDAAFLRTLPEEFQSDFLHGLFPQMIKDGLPVYAYEDDGYWNDLRDIPAYLSAQRDILENRVKTVLHPSDGVLFAGTKPPENVSITPPVYIGADVRIGSGAQIGPFAVLDDDCHVGHNAKIRGSVLLPSAYAGDRASMTGALLCHGASVRRGASLFEGVVLGAGSVVGEYASVSPDVRIWPDKKVESNCCQRENLHSGHQQLFQFDENGLTGETGVELTPEFCARLGAAVGSLARNEKIAVGCSHDKAASVMKMALVSGILSAGGTVWDFGPCIDPQFDYFVNFSLIRTGVYVCGGPRGSIRLASSGGLPAPRTLERAVESRLSSGDFVRAGWDSLREPTDMSGMRQLYRQELISMAPDGLSGVRAEVRGSDMEPVKLLSSVLSTIGCSMDGGLRLHLGAGGRRLSVFDPVAGYIWPERVLAMNCLLELKSGGDLALPYDAPLAIDRLAVSYGSQVKRYLSCPSDDTDRDARRLAANQPWARDGLMMAVRLLNWLKRTRSSIGELLEELPAFAVTAKTVPCSANPRKVLQKLNGGKRESRVGEGSRIRLPSGVVLVRPSKRGKSLILVAEAADSESAAELCGELEQKLGTVFLDIGEEKQ